MINTPASKNFIDQKTIISFVLGLIVGVILMGLVFSFSSTKVSKNSFIPAQEKILLGKVSLDKQRPLDAKKALNTEPRQVAIPQQTMPWQVASNFIVNGPIEKIEILSGLSIKLIMKNGPTFTTIQPKQDAYLEFVKKSGKSIEIVK